MRLGIQRQKENESLNVSLSESYHYSFNHTYKIVASHAQQPSVTHIYSYTPNLFRMSAA